MKTFAELSSRISYGVFALGVQSTPGGFRKTKSEKTDDWGVEGESQSVGLQKQL